MQYCLLYNSLYISFKIVYRCDTFITQPGIASWQYQWPIRNIMGIKPHIADLTGRCSTCFSAPSLSYIFHYVAHRGVEPRPSEPKSDVLPIYEWAILKYLILHEYSFYVFSTLSKVSLRQPLNKIFYKFESLVRRLNTWYPIISRGASWLSALCVALTFIDIKYHQLPRCFYSCCPSTILRGWKSFTSDLPLQVLGFLKGCAVLQPII